MIDSCLAIWIVEFRRFSSFAAVAQPIFFLHCSSHLSLIGLVIACANNVALFSIVKLYCQFFIVGGFYQDEIGQIECKLCSVGTRTSQRTAILEEKQRTARHVHTVRKLNSGKKISVVSQVFHCAIGMSLYHNQGGFKDTAIVISNITLYLEQSQCSSFKQQYAPKVLRHSTF